MLVWAEFQEAGQVVREWLQKKCPGHMLYNCVQTVAFWTKICSRGGNPQRSFDQ